MPNRPVVPSVWDEIEQEELRAPSTSVSVWDEIDREPPPMRPLPSHETTPAALPPMAPVPAHDPQRAAIDSFVSQPPQDDESRFRSWYADRAQPLGLNPDPDDPQHYYDYRGAFRAGAEPDEKGHWPSQFKREGHPNLIIDGIDTRTDQPAGIPPMRPVPSHGDPQQRDVDDTLATLHPEREPSAPTLPELATRPSMAIDEHRPDALERVSAPAGEFIKTLVGGSVGATAEGLTATGHWLGLADDEDLARVQGNTRLLAPSVQTSVLDDPMRTLGNPVWWAGAGGQVAGSVLGLAASSSIGMAGMGRAAQLLNMSAKMRAVLVPLAGQATASVAESWLESSLAYSEAIERGATPEQAGAAAAKVFAANVPITFLSEIPLFSPQFKSQIANALANALAEGGQEAAQEVVGNYSAQGYNPQQSLMEGVADAAIIGGVAGPIAGHLIERGHESLTPRGQDVSGAPVEPPIDTGSITTATPGDVTPRGVVPTGADPSQPVSTRVEPSQPVSVWDEIDQIQQEAPPPYDLPVAQFRAPTGAPAELIAPEIQQEEAPAQQAPDLAPPSAPPAAPSAPPAERFQQGPFFERKYNAPPADWSGVAETELRPDTSWRSKQRDVDPERINKLKETYDEWNARTEFEPGQDLPHVVLRDGEYHVLDGNHRLTAAMQLGRTARARLDEDAPKAQPPVTPKPAPESRSVNENSRGEVPDSTPAEITHADGWTVGDAVTFKSGRRTIQGELTAFVRVKGGKVRARVRFANDDSRRRPDSDPLGPTVETHRDLSDLTRVEENPSTDRGPAPIDILETGEAQPRLPGAAQARQAGRADTTFKAPQQASGDDFMLGPIETPEAAARRKSAEEPGLLDAPAEEAPQPSVPVTARVAPSSASAKPAPPITPKKPARSAAAPATLTVGERRELRRILKEMESMPFTKHSFVETVGKGGSLDVVGGAAGAPVFHDVMQGRSGNRAQVEAAIRRVLDGKPPTAVGQRAIDVARGRMTGDPRLSKPSLPMEAGESGVPAGAGADEVRAHTLSRVESPEDLEYLVDRYNERRDFKNVVSRDNSKELFPQYSSSPEGRTEFNDAVSDAAGVIAEAVYRRRLAEPHGSEATVVLTAGGTGSGKTTVASIDETAKYADIVFDSQSTDIETSARRIEQALESGREVDRLYVYRDPVDAWINGVLVRADDSGRPVSIDGHLASHQQALKAAVALTERFEGNPRVDLRVVDNTGETPHEITGADTLTFLREKAEAYNAEDVRRTLHTATEAVRDDLRPELYEALIGRAAQQDRPGRDTGAHPSGEGRSRKPATTAPPTEGGGERSKESHRRKPTRRSRGGSGGSGSVLSEVAGSPTRRAFAEPPRHETPVTPRGVVRPSDLVRRITELFNDLPIKQGHFRERAHGIYKVEPQVIRLKIENDLPTLAHELGHHVDKGIFGSELPYGLYADELLALGRNTSRARDSKKTKLAEGAAEFFRLYVSDPDEARRQAPEYYAAFEEALANSDEWGPAVREVQQMFLDYLQQDLATRGTTRIDYEGSDAAPSLFKQIAQDPKGFVGRLERAWVDDLAEAERVVRALEDETGEAIPYDESAYVLARLARGAAGKAQGFLHHGVRAADGTFISGSLEQILEPVATQLREFSDFLVALRVVELRGRGIEAGISIREARAILDRAVLPGYVDAVLVLDATRAGDDTGRTVEEAEALVRSQVREGFEPFDRARVGLYGYQDAILRYARQHGALSADQVRAIRGLNRFYVPFQRVLDTTEQTLTGTARKLANRGLPVKRIKGSGKDIIQPLESVIKNTFAVVDMVEKNRAMLALVDQAGEVKGSGRFIEQIPEPQIGTRFNLAQLSSPIRRALAEAGVDIAEVLPDGGELDLNEMVTVFTPATFAASGSNIVTVIRNGKREWYSVNDQALYDTITAVGPQIAGWVQALSAPASWLRAGATLTLGFIARNPVRDSFVAGVQSRYGFVPVVDTVKGLFSYLSADEYYKDFLNSGAANAALVSRDRNHVRNELRTIVERRTVPRNPIEMLRALSEATEMATRLGEFRRGVEQEGRSQEGLARAALAARDVTLDFARAGSVARQVNQFAAFFNARVQGYARLVELAKADARRAVNDKDLNPMHYASGRAALYIALLSALVWALNADDKDYEEIPAWEKATYWHIPLGGGRGWIRVPKPFEWGTIFGTTTEAALSYLKTKDPAKLRNLFPDGPGPTLRGSLLSVLPVAITPWVEIWSNYDFFRDRNIVSPYDTDLPPELQYSRWTSDSAKAIGSVMGVSPAKIDHLVNGYFAGIGRAVMRAPSVLEDLGGKAKAPASTAGDLPLVGTFYRDGEMSGQAESLQELYDAAEMLRGASRAHKIYEESGDSKRAARVIRDAGPLAARKGAIDAAVSNLRRLRPTIDAIYENTTLSPAEKRQRLDRVYEAMVRIARQALGKPVKAPIPVTAR